MGLLQQVAMPSVVRDEAVRAHPRLVALSLSLCAAVSRSPSFTKTQDRGRWKVRKAARSITLLKTYNLPEVILGSRCPFNFAKELICKLSCEFCSQVNLH